MEAKGRVPTIRYHLFFPGLPRGAAGAMGVMDQCFKRRVLELLGACVSRAGCCCVSVRRWRALARAVICRITL